MEMENNGDEEGKNEERGSLEWDSSTTPTAAAAVRQGLRDERWRELIGDEEEAQQLVLPKVGKFKQAYLPHHVDDRQRAFLRGLGVPQAVKLGPNFGTS